MRAITKIVVHCTATPSNREYTPDMMLRDHKARGFATYGYHYYVRRDGTIIPLRPITQAGAHVRGHNHDSIGVCYEGGVRAGGSPNNPRDAADTRTPLQKQSLFILLIGLKQMLGAAVQIVGHRDLSPDTNGNGVVELHEWVKMCPCFDAGIEYAGI